MLWVLEAWMRHLSGAEPGSVIDYKGTVVIGTVFQDVHSIGKDLAKTLLDNYGYRTIDLGVQVPLEQFIETARQEKADAIGMSALLVQTSNHMITVSRMLEEQMFDIPVLIGALRSTIATRVTLPCSVRPASIACVPMFLL